MPPRRIAYVLKIFPKLSETFIAGELAELRRRGVELRILSLLPPREQLRHAVICESGLDELVCYEPQAFSGIVREFKPHLLHAHFATESTAWARDLARESQLPFTFTSHGYDIFRKPPRDFAERAAAARAVVTVSRVNAAHICQTFGVPGSRVHVIPCGVDTAKFCPNGTTLSDPPLIACVARLVAVKNLPVLLRACGLLRARGVEFRCVLVGEGPCRPELEALRADLGLDELLTMPGAAEQGSVVQIWRQAAVAVLSSDNEGLPVSLIEAGACGVPAVATRVGGIPELIEDGGTGLLVPSGDPEALADALARLLLDPALRLRMGKAARERVLENFSLSNQVDQLLALWSSVLAE